MSERNKTEPAGSSNPTVSRFHPWRVLRGLPDVILAQVDDLPSGKSWWAPEYRLVLLDRRLGQADRRCALAHELAHRAMGHQGTETPAKKMAARLESEANQLSARWLIILPDLLHAARWTTDRREMADELWVTPAVLSCRLRHLHPAERAQLMLATEHHREA